MITRKHGAANFDLFVKGSPEMISSLSKPDTGQWANCSVAFLASEMDLCLPKVEPVVHNWFIKGCGMYCSVYGKVHIKDPLLLIEKSSLCGGSGFPSKKCVNVTI